MYRIEKQKINSKMYIFFIKKVFYNSKFSISFMTYSGKSIFFNDIFISQDLISSSVIFELGILSLIMLADSLDKPKDNKCIVVWEAAPISKNRGIFGIELIYFP